MKKLFNMTKHRRVTLLATATLSGLVMAQNPGMRHSVKHTANAIKALVLVPANQRPPTRNQVDVDKNRDEIEIESNGIPRHMVGKFPNKNNPNKIAAQDYDFELPTNPVELDRPIPQQSPEGPLLFGMALNGVVFDPGTAEFWDGDPRAGYNYEALGAAVPLGLDENHAHVQPTGAYHYHGLPMGFLKSIGLKSAAHSPLVGYAADGFPIYALFGYSDPKNSRSEVISMESSYRLKTGDRETQPRGPGGSYDGTFTSDYEYKEGLGDLDECNGRFTITPEFPEGSYAYFLTRDFPVIPRLFRGEPVNIRGEMEHPPHGPDDRRRPPHRHGPPPRR